MRRGYGKRESFDCLSFVRMEVCGRERETCVEENGLVVR